MYRDILAIGLSRTNLFFTTGYNRDSEIRVPKQLEVYEDPACVVEELEASPHFSKEDWLVQVKNQWMRLIEASRTGRLSCCTKIKNRSTNKVIWDSFTKTLRI